MQVWDNSKKTFKKKKIGVDGEIVNEEHKQIMKDKKRIEHMQERYKNWKKKSTMNFQKMGDREVASNTMKAKNSFKNRMEQKHVAESIKRKKQENHHVKTLKATKFGKKEGFMKGRKIKSELKSYTQIAKDKVKNRIKAHGKPGGFKNKHKGGKKHK